MNNPIHRVWMNPSGRTSMVPCVKNVAHIVASVALLGACAGRSDMDLPPNNMFDASFADTLGQLDGPGDRWRDTRTDTPTADGPIDTKPSTCTPDTCSGCCDDDDVCRIGGAKKACGRNGARCVNCEKTNTVCVWQTGLCEQPLPPACNASSCQGCCDAQGRCHMDQSTTHCGIRGRPCENCSASMRECDASMGQCIDTSLPRCSASVCGGCCDTNNYCHDGTASSACGINGKLCINCTTVNATCDNKSRLCQHNPTPNCNASNCRGCCDKRGLCQRRQTSDRCGINGSACVNCQELKAYCNISDGRCEQLDPIPKCDPSTCPNGCCNSYGYCMPGIHDNACGSGGRTCETCPASTTCNPKAQACIPVETQCSPSNCKGCCDGPTCHLGTDASACGANGQTCVDCTSSSMTCSPTSQSCVPAMHCGETSCNGCCNTTDGTCQDGKQQSSCGEQGDVCHHCNNSHGVCVTGTFGGGICIAPGASQTCNADTCNGCCECTSTDNCVCREGTKPQACGHDARICQTCNMSPSISCVSLPTGGGRCTFVSAP